MSIKSGKTAFDSLSNMEKIYLKICEDEFMQAISH